MTLQPLSPSLPTVCYPPLPDLTACQELPPRPWLIQEMFSKQQRPEKAQVHYCCFIKKRLVPKQGEGERQS